MCLGNDWKCLGNVKDVCREDQRHHQEVSRKCLGCVPGSVPGVETELGDIVII